jgi:aromatic ring-opening dioxygenase LigB subunit
MPLVYACIAPHGEPIIPSLALPSERRRYAATTRAMQQLGREMRRARPQVIVIATPHNLRLRGTVGVVVSEHASGTLPMFSSRKPVPRVHIRVQCDREFADSLLAQAARHRVPAVGANYATASGKYSNMPLDWGTLVPLWFFMRGHRVRPKVVVVTPSREIPLLETVRFGRVIADIAQKSAKRIAFVASADHAHAHRKSGPYGFSPAAARYDAQMVKAIQGNNLPSVLQISPRLVRDAKPDSLWQVAMLAGVAARLRLRPELLSYQVPTYYGMICGAFRRSIHPHRKSPEGR